MKENYKNIEFTDNYTKEDYMNACEALATSKLLNTDDFDVYKVFAENRLQEYPELYNEAVNLSMMLPERESTNEIYENSPLSNLYEELMIAGCDVCDGDENQNQALDTYKYNLLIERLTEARNNNTPFNQIQEGLFSSILGGAAGLTFGPSVMKAVCEALGVDVKGTFGSLLTSRVILAAVGAKIGWRV